ncbi:hypothetical protein RF55_20703 [Lasius niger]|uniref:Uncharacterized protein n=1 Tax=Lasius niger TaxID=67767 RepID=A0A0J7JYR7_LASNI|nr:hypothetical protein RF55_20703 [Lasius niger]
MAAGLVQPTRIDAQDDVIPQDHQDQRLLTSISTAFVEDRETDSGDSPQEKSPETVIERRASSHPTHALI